MTDLDTEDWFKDWRKPHQFFDHARATRDLVQQTHGAGALEERKYRYLDTAWVAGRFACVLDSIDRKARTDPRHPFRPSLVRLNAHAFPQFLLHIAGEEVGFEILLADRRTRPRPVDPALEEDDDDGDPAKRREAAIEALTRTIHERAQKDYGFKTNLLLHMKHPDPDGVDLDLDQLAELTQPASARCTAIWLLWGDRLCRTWPKRFAWPSSPPPAPLPAVAPAAGASTGGAAAQVTAAQATKT